MANQTPQKIFGRNLVQIRNLLTKYNEIIGIKNTYLQQQYWYMNHQMLSGVFKEPGYITVLTDVLSRSGPRLNIKTVLSTYGDFHVKDKTAVRTSYL